ncbi:MAG: rhomboid family intramembrane serine protease [Gammaproteobacteria bacterium]|nr:MAG: rhomboid family intramembrane serine protease [Gammaproteobacteria bacterium]
MIPVSDTVPRRYPPVMVWLLIATNAAVFLFELSLPDKAAEAFFYHYGLVPARYTHPDWAMLHGLDPYNYLPFITDMFLHGGLAHIVLNMWTLWLFGAAVEDRLGSLRFLIFYFLCGLAANVTHLLVNADSTVPVVGASGAIAGVMGAYMVMFPLARIVFFIPILFIPFFFELPAVIFMAIWFWLQFLEGTQSLLSTDIHGGVAWWAHIGGFLTGIVLTPFFRIACRHCRPYFRDESLWGHGPRGE